MIFAQLMLSFYRSLSHDGVYTICLALHKRPETSYLLGQQSDDDLELPAVIR